MAFTAAEKAQIRRYMGRSPLGRNYDTALESSITSIENLGDSAETEGLIRSLLGQLATIQTQLTSFHSKLMAGEVDELKVDYARAVAALRNEGRRLVGNISVALDYSPRADAFSPRRAP